MQSALNKLSLQFLCGVPLNELSFPKANHLKLEDQEILLNTTVNSDLVLNYPLKIDYQKAFLKHFIDQFEKQGLDIHEDWYQAYGRLVGVSELSQEYYKHYRIGNKGTVLSLKENVNLISEGTTGLRTWQASLALSEWCLNNKNLILKKNILELGSGIGLTGLVASLECCPNQFTFSDCHPSVLESLCENIKFNNRKGVFADNNLKNRSYLDKKLQNGVNISVLNLPWEDVTEAVCGELGTIDFILAADVVYDSGLFKPLVDALRCISKRCRVDQIVFACTERNPETLELFLKEIGEHFKVIEEVCPRPNNFIWSVSPPVRIFQFRLLEICIDWVKPFTSLKAILPKSTNQQK